MRRKVCRTAARLLRIQNSECWFDLRLTRCAVYSELSSLGTTEDRVGMRGQSAFVGCLLGVALLCAGSMAQTTHTYSYDPLGRLTKVSPSGTTATCYSYDPSDNRTLVSGGCSFPPVAVADSFFRVGGVNNNPVSGTWSVRNNDTDPNLPSDTLTVISVTPGAGAPNVSVSSGGAAVAYTATAGYYEFSYTIQDSTGLTASVTSNFTISCRVGAPC
jgi:YD repeat-containing protein